jgi:hypothetical protein
MVFFEKLTSFAINAVQSHQKFGLFIPGLEHKFSGCKKFHVSKN